MQETLSGFAATADKKQLAEEVLPSLVACAQGQDSDKRLAELWDQLSFEDRFALLDLAGEARQLKADSKAKAFVDRLRRLLKAPAFEKARGDYLEIGSWAQQIESVIGHAATAITTLEM